MIEVLAALSASAAVGIRIALPLLGLEILQGEALWLGIPILSNINPSIRLAFLCSWSMLELLASKNLLGQRLLQIVMLVSSPIAGAIAANAIAKFLPVWIIAILGGLFALLLQSVQTAWFYRQHKRSLKFVFAQDILSILLVFLAVKQPQLGGIISLSLLWWAIRSYQASAKWYSKH
ncbi:DUF4126 domain-containing protein [Synechocystis sp. PCC 7509]|uniref:DUF4126 domain-containing protein n=1 Tax=Synechocystis sp. PCC 7509 TaxID=927677 RepID=UPI0002AC43DD|nr:DUF4126 domain-containing protein [Synechocystis sp. PCC 7509]